MSIAKSLLHMNLCDLVPYRYSSTCLSYQWDCLYRLRNQSAWILWRFFYIWRVIYLFRFESLHLCVWRGRRREVFSDWKLGSFIIYYYLHYGQLQEYKLSLKHTCLLLDLNPEHLITERRVVFTRLNHCLSSAQCLF